MATTVIRNSIVAGALGGLLSQRSSLSFTPSDYATAVNAADAIASECITRNLLLTAPMADADNNQIGVTCLAAAYAACQAMGAVSATATDYLSVANQIVASAKQAAGKLT